MRTIIAIFVVLNLTFEAHAQITSDQAVKALIAYQYQGGRCFDGPQSTWLMRSAQAHAEDMARRHRPDHHAFLQPGFFDSALKATGCGSVRESSSQSWPEHANSDGPTLAADVWQSWSYNKTVDPWKIGAVKHKLYGLGMARGSDGIWYTALLIAD